MGVTECTFSFLPDLTDEQIEAQIQYALGNGWAIAVEYTDDPHPRNIYWDMWGQPMFDVRDPAAVMLEIGECRRAFPRRYIRVSGYDRSLGRATTTLSFIVNRPQPQSYYNASKAAVHQLTKSLAAEWASRGIRVK